MKTYSQAEFSCQDSFLSAGPYWHAYSSGKDTPILFSKDEDLTFVMNVIAQAAFKFSPSFDASGKQTGGIMIITFEVMNNHFHFIVSGDKLLIEEFLAFIRRRLKRSIPGAAQLKFRLKPIESLSALRNGIVYSNRNGYVAFNEHTPFSYPWGSNRYYFNTIPATQRYGDIYLGPKRKMFRGRAPELPNDWALIDGYIIPTSYCAIRFGMSLFRDAHHYFNALTKQVESYSEIAVDIEDGEFLTDAELFSKIITDIRNRYQVDSISKLSPAQKNELARTLHYDYRSSNGQIRRVLGMSQYDVDALFPLSAK